MIDLDSLDGINIIALEQDTSSPSKTSAVAPVSQEDANLLTCMLITANVGTIFEDSTLLDLWFQQLKSYLTRVRPQLVAIHCQEVGGKNYESSMKHVSDFTDKLIGDESTIEDYTRIRIFLDENFESLEKFTALGNLYLIHDSVRNVKLYNFKTAQYEPIEGRKVFAGNTINKAAEHVEKVKFPLELFPECRWSRKGFMRTRWLLNNIQPIDLVNIHLFHDASNLIAMEKTPSPYAQDRQRALEFTLEKIALPLKGTWEQSQQQQTNQKDRSKQSIPHLEVPLFIFGDFNFRLDTSKVVHRITEGVSPVIKRSADSNEVLEFVYHRKNENDKLTSTHSATKNKYNDQQACVQRVDSKDDDGNSNYLESGTGRVVMTVGKKLFDCENLDETFRATKNTKWLQELDNELDRFKSKLMELKISFSPSYPFKEDTTGGYSYMKTRCPAWCDRILFNTAASKLIYGTSLSRANIEELDSEKRLELLQNRGDVIYRLMGNSVPMGDHKPVLLYCQLNLSSKEARTSNCKMSQESKGINCGSSSLLESTAM